MVKKIMVWMLIVCCAVPAYAAPALTSQGYRAARWYKVYWTGIHIGNLISEIREENGKYHMVTRMESRGFVRKITHFRTDTVSVSHYQDGAFLPLRFYSETLLRKRKRSITLEYTPTGALLKELVLPPDKPKKVPPVSAALKPGTIDPQTSVLMAYQHIKEAMRTGATGFVLPLYEGRRRSNLHFTVHKNTLINQIPVVHISFYREPLAGFSKTDLREMKDTEPVIHMYLEENNDLLPLKIEAEARIGRVTAIFEKECIDFLRCDYDGSKKNQQ